MERKPVNPQYVIDAMQERINVLVYEIALKDAYIRQLEEESKKKEETL